jgi:hypothetical protein
LMLQNKTPTSQPIYDVRTNPLIRKKKLGPWTPEKGKR